MLRVLAPPPPGGMPLGCQGPARVGGVAGGAQTLHPDRVGSLSCQHDII